MACSAGFAFLFLSTLSLRRATKTGYHCRADRPHFYPRSPCGERQCKRCHCPQQRTISIHALLAESDLPITCCLHMRHAVFLSTLSLRRATGILGRRVRHGQQFLSTLSLRRATVGKYAQYAVTGISIHALLAESDDHGNGLQKQVFAFLSTLSLRRATYNALLKENTISISIHALLAESDPSKNRICTKSTQFLSTLSLRRATHGQKLKDPRSVFLSTLSLRRATQCTP